ncbi:MAG: hypothetical protein KF693_03805 [Nitrospira sp.]|nr:hypothetical protein [Nitrospira sp.]
MGCAKIDSPRAARQFFQGLTPQFSGRALARVTWYFIPYGPLQLLVVRLAQGLILLPRKDLYVRRPRDRRMLREIAVSNPAIGEQMQVALLLEFCFIRDSFEAGEAGWRPSGATKDWASRARALDGGK